MNTSMRRPADAPARDGRLLLQSRRQEVVTLTLNRPGQLNALSGVLLDELLHAFTALQGDESLRCVILAAAGKAFCAGHDVREMRAEDDEAWFRALFARCSEVMQAIRALPVPVIAAVQGAAAAAGCQLVAACDLAIAAKSARFAVSGIDLGLFCSTPAVALSRSVPPKAAFDMLVTGRFITADEALACGLVSAVSEDGTLAAAAAAYADEIAAKTPAAIRLGKKMFYAQAAMGLAEAYAFAGGEMARNMMFAATRAGIDAFLDRRKS